MEKQINALDLPLNESRKVFDQIDDICKELPWYAFMTRMVMPALGRVADMQAKSTAMLTCAGVALAVERYRLAQGKLPEELEELVPDYLSTLPIDPFDGKLLKYERTPAIAKFVSGPALITRISFPGDRFFDCLKTVPPRNG